MFHYRDCRGYHAGRVLFVEHHDWFNLRRPLVEILRLRGYPLSPLNSINSHF